MRSLDHSTDRQPTGIFYAQCVKVPPPRDLFFDRKPAQEKPWTTKLWIYDLRTNQHFTLNWNPLKPEHLADFVKGRAYYVSSRQLTDPALRRPSQNLIEGWQM